MRINPRKAAAAIGSGPRLGERGWSPAQKILLALCLILLAATWGLAVLPAIGEEAPPATALKEMETVTGPVNYERAVRLALRSSPFFTKSSLEIEIKRLDETDSKFNLVPSVTFRTQYYITRPTERDFSNRPYTLSFVSSDYNPVESFFTLQAKKIFTRIAILAHMQVISEGIQRLGRMFLEIEALDQAAARQVGLVDLARQNLDYCQNRLRLGTGTSLEVKLAKRELEAAQAEKERLASSRKRLLARIKAFIGLKPHQPLELDCQDARRQVMGDFNPTAASLEEAKNRSYLLKIAELKKELQNFNIMMAKAKLLPSVFLAATTPDPLSGLQSRELFFSVGLEVPVWDGFNRVRNISRQKTILRQFGADKEEKVLEFADKWFEVQENLRNAEDNRKAALDLEELAHLKERQSEIRYRAGGEPLSIYLEGRKNLVDAEKNSIRKNYEHNVAALGVRHLAGDLGASYVDAKSWQQ